MLKKYLDCKNVTVNCLQCKIYNNNYNHGQRNIKKHWQINKTNDFYNDKNIINDNKHLIIPGIIEIDKKLKEYGKIW